VISQPIDAISEQSDVISELNILITKNALSKLIGEAHFFYNYQQSTVLHSVLYIPHKGSNPHKFRCCI
jgi:hypothetical protein